MIEISEGYMILDIYREEMTIVKTILCGRTEYFEVKVTLHYGYARSPLCFIIIINNMVADEAGTKPAWVTLFEDDSVLVSGTVEEVEEELERWRSVIDTPITKDFELSDRKQSRPPTWCHLVNGV